MDLPISQALGHAADLAGVRWFALDIRFQFTGWEAPLVS
jgi:hypothetical protein